MLVTNPRTWFVSCRTDLGWEIGDARSVADLRPISVRVPDPNPERVARATSVSKTVYILQQALNWLGKQSSFISPYSQVHPVRSSQLVVLFDTLFISIHICLIYIPGIIHSNRVPASWWNVCAETSRVFGTLSEVWRERSDSPWVQYPFNVHSERKPRQGSRKGFRLPTVITYPCRMMITRIAQPF